MRGPPEGAAMKMGRNCLMILAALVLSSVATTAQQPVGAGEWTTLFDGSNLDNWNPAGNLKVRKIGRAHV